MLGVLVTPSFVSRPLSEKVRLGATGGWVSRLRAGKVACVPVLPAWSCQAPMLRACSPLRPSRRLSTAVYTVSLTLFQPDKVPAGVLTTGSCAGSSLKVSVSTGLSPSKAAAWLHWAVRVGAVASTVQALALLCTRLVLPAASVWRTCTWPAK